MKEAETDGEDILKHLRRRDDIVLKQVLDHISNDKVIRSVRKTMRERRENSSLYQYGYIPSLRTSTPTNDRDQLRHILNLSKSRLDQELDNGRVEQQVEQLMNQTISKCEYNRTGTPRSLLRLQWDLHPARGLLSRGSYNTRAQLCNENSIDDENYDDYEEDADDEEEEEEQGEEDIYYKTNAKIETEHLPSEDLTDERRIINEEADRQSALRQSVSEREEANSEMYRNDSKTPNTKKHHVRFNDDKLIIRITSAKAIADQNMDELSPDLIKVVFSDTNMKYNISKEHAFGVSDNHGESNKVKSVLSNKEQWQNTSIQADGDRNQTLRSYKLNEIKPRMYEAQSKENRAPKDTKELPCKTNPGSAKTRELQHRIASAKTRYSRLIYSDTIRNENMDIQERLVNAVPLVDSWNRLSLGTGTRHEDPIGDNQVPVVGSVEHYQQIRQENADNQARLSKAKSKISSWQSGQIMSLLTAGQAKAMKQKRNNMH